MRKLIIGITIMIVLGIAGFFIIYNPPTPIEHIQNLFGDIASDSSPIEPIEPKCGDSVCNGDETYKTCPEDCPEPLPKSPLPLTQIEDELFEIKRGYNNGLLYSEILYPEKKENVFEGDLAESNYPKLKVNKPHDYIDDGGAASKIKIALEETELDIINVITLYVRAKKEGIDDRTFTAKFIMGDGSELITLDWIKEDLEKGWWTNWGSISGEWTPEQLENARIELITTGTGEPINISSVRLLVQRYFSLVDNFDSYNTGDLNGQGSWSGDAEWDVATGDPPAHSGSNGAECGTNAKEIGKTFTAEASGAQIAYLQTSAINSGKTNHRFIFYDGATYAGHLTLNEGGGGTIYLNDSADLGSFSADTWYKCEVEWDANQGDNGQFRARIDDGTWSSWTDGLDSFTQIDQVAFMSQDNTPSTFYVDDLSDPNAAARRIIITQ